MVGLIAQGQPVTSEAVTQAIKDLHSQASVGQQNYDAIQQQIQGIMGTTTAIGQDIGNMKRTINDNDEATKKSLDDNDTIIKNTSAAEVVRINQAGQGLENKMEESYTKLGNLRGNCR